MSKTIIDEAVEVLDQAYAQKQSIAPLKSQFPTLQIPDAYQIQKARLQKELSTGEIVSGKKIGLTSLAMQQLLGVDQPDFGHLLQSMEVSNGATIKRHQLFEPKVEGEIAFVLKQDLVGPNVTVEDVLAATDYVVAAIEIVDSRIANWQIQIEDTIADNASCGLYVLGDQKIKVSDIDLKAETMQLKENGAIYNEGKGTDVLGDPAYCVAWLANTLYEYDVQLKAGEVILSGALSAAAIVKEGYTYTAVFPTLGEVTVSFE